MLATAFPGARGPDRRPITDMLMVSIDFLARSLNVPSVRARSSCLGGRTDGYCRFVNGYSGLLNADPSAARKLVRYLWGRRGTMAIGVKV